MAQIMTETRLANPVGEAGIEKALLGNQEQAMGFGLSLRFARHGLRQDFALSAELLEAWRRLVTTIFFRARAASAVTVDFCEGLEQIYLMIRYSPSPGPGMCGAASDLAACRQEIGALGGDWRLCSRGDASEEIHLRLLI